MGTATKILAGLAAGTLLAACATVPTGPSVMTLPGSSKSFEQFRADETECRGYAQQQTGGGANQASAQSGVQSAAIGTAVGAVAGAAFGGSNGAAVGAGTGLIVGSMAGAGAAQETAYGTQKQYDAAYVQCMYARGHKVPVSASLARGVAAPQSAPQPIAPPPQGIQPPPAPERIKR